MNFIEKFIDRKLRRISWLIYCKSSNKAQQKNMIEADYTCPKITEQTINGIKKHPELYLNSSAITQNGNLYLDGEFEKRSDEVLSRQLPQEERGPVLQKNEITIF